MSLMLNSAVETCDCYPFSTPVNSLKCPSCTAETPSETLCFSPTSHKPKLDIPWKPTNLDPLSSDSTFSDPPTNREESLSLDEIYKLLSIPFNNDFKDDDSGSETEDCCIYCGEAYCNRLCVYYEDVFEADLAGKV